MSKQSLSILEIKVKLATDDKWLYRGLLAIYACQTSEEQATEATLESNGVGFNGADAGILSSFAEQLKVKPLTEKQRIIARNKMIKYAGQLKQIADSKL